ncbi:hypothetical protein BDZ45DRAFT_321460 [Acephala macrosclerotiorum]|nr:hypothetical protein BDZ45DRAFT_321460 [Acephala macrosclerotiorum]
MLFHWNAIIHSFSCGMLTGMFTSAMQAFLVNQCLTLKPTLKPNFVLPVGSGRIRETWFTKGFFMRSNIFHCRSCSSSCLIFLFDVSEFLVLINTLGSFIWRLFERE